MIKQRLPYPGDRFRDQWPRKSIPRISAPRADDSGVLENPFISSGVHRSRADSLRRERHPTQAEAGGVVDSICDRSARGPSNGLARA